MKSNNVVNIKDYAQRRLMQTQHLQAIANKRHKDAEIVRRWQLRQSVETITKRMKLGSTLYVQAVLRENFVAILPPVESALRKAA